MEVHLESEEQMGQTIRRERKGKRRRPAGRMASSPAVVAEQTGRFLAEREHEWLERLTSNPASFAAVELRFTSKRGGRPTSTSPGCWPRRASTRDGPPRRQGSMRPRCRCVRLKKKKTPLGGTASGRLGDHGDDAVLLAASRTGKGRGSEGGGLYPELAAYRISEGSSPNVQAEVGRLVGLLPIEQARAELARRGLEVDEKAVRRISAELGTQMLATRTRDLLRFRAGELPAGTEFAGKRSRSGWTVVGSACERSSRRCASGQRKRKKFQDHGASPRSSFSSGGR